MRRLWAGIGREDLAYWALVSLVCAAFLLGGGARDDILSLLVLRPLGAIALVFGLSILRIEDVRVLRAPFLLLGALLLLIGLHLLPLPPMAWSLLPGREIAWDAGVVAGIEQPWRPITLVPWRGWNAFYAMLIPAAALALAASCRPDQRRKLVNVVLLLGMLSVVFGMLQAISGYNDALYPYAITNAQSPNGLFANRNHQAAMICAMLPLLAVFATSATNPMGVRLRTWLAAGAGGVMLLVLLISGSRAGIGLGVVAMAAVVLIQGRSAGPGKRRNKLFTVALLGAGVVLVGFLAATFLNIGAIDRLIAADANDEVRFQAWPIIVGMVGEYFPVGSGVGSFVEVYKLHEPHRMLNTNYLNHAHNDVLEWILEGGLPAAILILAAVAGWTRATLRLRTRIQRHQGDRGLAMAGSAVIFILGLASLVDYPLRAPSLTVLVVLAAVWLVAPAQRAEVRSGKNGEGRSHSSNQVSRRPN